LKEIIARPEPQDQALGNRVAFEEGFGALLYNNIMLGLSRIPFP